MSQKTILYVEDNEFNRKIIRQLLAQTSYRLREAHEVGGPGEGNRLWKDRGADSRRPLVLVGRTRFELVTNGLKVRCSTS